MVESNYINQSSQSQSSQYSEYEPAKKWTSYDLIILMELVQFIPYKHIKRAIDLCSKLSLDFIMPSSGYLNRIIQSKKKLFNQIGIAWKTSNGEYDENLVLGLDGSSNKRK